MSLSVLAWDHPRATAPLKACSEAWRRRTGEPLTVTTRSLQAFGDDVPRSDGHDLVLIDHPHVGLAAAGAAILPVDGLVDERRLARLEAESAGASARSYTHAGRRWAVAVDASCQALAMSHAAREVTTPPATWDEVLALAVRHPEGVALPLTPAHALSALLSMIAAREPLTGGPRLASDEVLRWAVGVLTWLAETGPEQSFEWEPPEALTQLATGQLLCVPLAYAYVGYDVRWSGAPAARSGGRPGSILGGVGAAVLSGSRQPGAAAEFAAWLGSPGVQRDLILTTGGQPATASSWTAPGADPMFAAVLPTLLAAEMRPRAAWWPGFQATAGDLLADRLQTGAEPDEIAREVAGLYHNHYEDSP